MPRWFLSYHSPDEKPAAGLKSAIQGKDPALEVFFAPTHLRAGGAWTAQLAEELKKADAFILLIGKHGVGKWQVPEYDEALDRWVKSGRTFPLIVVLLEGETAPGLPFLRQLHWIVTPDPASEKDIARIFDAALGRGAATPELWRHASPYRGLEAMEEKDSDFFFGRTKETVEALERARRARPSADRHRQFRRGQILAGAGGGAGGAQAPGLARRRARVACGLRQQPPMVLSDAQARRRADQSAHRMLLRGLAV